MIIQQIKDHVNPNRIVIDFAKKHLKELPSALQWEIGEATKDRDENEGYAVQDAKRRAAADE
jgi:hypothetical protein